MTEPDANPETSITETARSASILVPSSDMAQDCLDIIEEFWRGLGTTTDKAGAIQELVVSFTTGMAELTISKYDDTLQTYLRILNQHASVLL